MCFGQDLLPAVSDEEMKAMEAEIVRVQQQLSESEQSWSALNSGKCMCTAICVGLCTFRYVHIAVDCSTSLLVLNVMNP